VATIKGLVELIVETDVFIIGGGGSGASAAVAAASAGARVTLAIKGALGRSGNTIMSSAVVGMDGESAFRYGEKRADRAFTKNVLFEKIVKHGFYLSEQDLVEQYVDQAGPRVYQLLEWLRLAKQSFLFVPPGSWLTSGKAIGLACRQAMRRTPGIDVFEDVMICDLLMNNGRVVGALGVDIYTGKLIVFKAKAVVLATGGYQPFSFKCSHSDMTGDGMAMAYRAGADLADMEFLLFLPGVLLSPQIHRSSIFPFIWYVSKFAVPDIVNSAGQKITDHMPPKLVTMAQSTEWVKLIYSYYWGKEIAAGHGTPNGGVYFDFSNLSKIQYIKGALKAFLILKRLYRKNWWYQGENISDLNKMARNGIPWEVSLSNEYSMGGIVVDTEMSTGVPGLFAAGEVTSGVFGASRGARALTEMLVHGHQAGRFAAQYSRDGDTAQIDVDQLAEVKARALRPFEQNGKHSPLVIQNALNAAADSGFGVIRDEKGLRATLKEIERIRDEDLPQMRVSSQTRTYNYEWIVAMQVENLTTCIEAGVRSGLERRESRGHHIRSDCPQVDNDNWLVRIVVGSQNGKMVLTTRKPAFTSLPPPIGKFDSVMHYVLECGSESNDIGYASIDIK